jgi:hypothetical protein
MTTISGRAALFLGVVLLGCTATADKVVAPPAMRLDRVDAAAANGGAEQSVTGHATILLSVFGFAEEKYSNTAIRHADGSFSGQFELKSAQEGGLRIHGDIVCFGIVGTNIARIAGRVDQSNYAPVPEGSIVLWTVVDNGEGANDPPDQTSDFVGPFPEAAAPIHCAAGINLGAFFPVLSGNLQVHA